MTGAKVGILGLGRIGETIAERLSAFRCKSAYHNRHEKDVVHRYLPTPEALAEWADVLVVTTPGVASTEVLVGAGVLAALRERGYLVNIARVSVVDQSRSSRRYSSAPSRGPG